MAITILPSLNITSLPHASSADNLSIASSPLRHRVVQGASSQVIVSFFISTQPTMAANNEMPVALDKEQIFGMAEKEMEYRVELFNKYKESELNMGENSCIDRCVSKYWQVTNLVGQLLGSGRPPM
uniref:Mitochondrial import inner membrane translocase subunit n=1 Tax=Lactuca sativa TaxID=4236 RepID=A0A9R1WPE0_LACSA|nr:hypothetical protein LSAT_V11C900465320 [Lactuca sativa]